MPGVPKTPKPGLPGPKPIKIMPLVIKIMPVGSPQAPGGALGAPRGRWGPYGHDFYWFRARRPRGTQGGPGGAGGPAPVSMGPGPWRLPAGSRLLGAKPPQTNHHVFCENAARSDDLRLVQLVSLASWPPHSRPVPPASRPVTSLHPFLPKSY